MTVIFLMDYVGRETAMQIYHEYDVVDIPLAQALELVRLEIVEEVE